MLTAEQNRRITETGPGTPAGALMRRYWQPAALTEELATNRPVKPVTLLGEELVLFKDEEGRYGLVERHCCHRGADLAFGRLEDGGLRCPFHGWLFDVEGACLQQPAEPPGSNYHRKVRQPAYPCAERNGIVFAYMGPLAEGEAPPALPEFDCFAAPEAYSFAWKGLMECNWLQAFEVGIDPAHASFLHRFFEDEEEEAYGQQFRGQTKDIPVTKVLREHPCPRLEVESTEYGLRIFALRDLDGGNTHIRVTNAMFPHAIVIPMSEQMTITQWHVPVDDTHCYWYAMFTAYDRPVDKDTMRAQRLEGCTLPDYRPVRNKANDYGFDPDEQARLTYTGMGTDINVHDQWAVESLGPIQDRTREHLGASDKAITAYRKRLFAAMETVEAGEDPPLVLRGGDAPADAPVAVDTIGPSDDWREAWRRFDGERRAGSGWAAAA